MQSTFIAAINQLCDEKNLPREVVLDTVKAALRAAYRKDYGNREQNVDVDLDEKSGNITVYLLKEIVKKVELPDTQISVAEAKKYNLSYPYDGCKFCLISKQCDWHNYR